MKISKSKHITREGIVKSNPGKGVNIYSIPSPNIPEGSEYIERNYEDDEYGEEQEEEEFDYYKATIDMKDIILKQLKLMGATKIQFLKGEYGLDIICSFNYKGEGYKFSGIKHLYNVDDDEPITGLWNWHSNFGYKELSRIMREKIGIPEV